MVSCRASADSAGGRALAEAHRAQRMARERELKQLKLHELRRRGQTPRYADGTPVPEALFTRPWVIHAEWLTVGPIFYSAAEFFARVLGPYFLRQFVRLVLIFKYRRICIQDE